MEEDDLLLDVHNEDKVVILIEVFHLDVDGGVMGHCFGEFSHVVVANRVRGCQSLKGMRFPRGG